jgi:hypothetical protein
MPSTNILQYRSTLLKVHVTEFVGLINHAYHFDLGVHNIEI